MLLHLLPCLPPCRPHVIRFCAAQEGQVGAILTGVPYLFQRAGAVLQPQVHWPPQHAATHQRWCHSMPRKPLGAQQAARRCCYPPSLRLVFKGQLQGLHVSITPAHQSETEICSRWFETSKTFKHGLLCVLCRLTLRPADHSFNTVRSAARITPSSITFCQCCPRQVGAMTVPSPCDQQRVASQDGATYTPHRVLVTGGAGKAPWARATSHSCRLAKHVFDSFRPAPQVSSPAGWRSNWCSNARSARCRTHPVATPPLR